MHFVLKKQPCTFMIAFLFTSIDQLYMLNCTYALPLNFYHWYWAINPNISHKLTIRFESE